MDELKHEMRAMGSRRSTALQPADAPTAGGIQGSGLPPSEPGVTPIAGAVESGDLPRASISQSGGIGVPGGSFPPVPPPQNRFDSPATLEDKRGRVRFGPGFELVTDDAEFILQFHDLTQLDYRGYLQGGQDSVHDSFGLPRQRYIFSGHITKEIGFMASLQKGFDAVTGLDMFLDLNYDRRLQFRMGRFKTPFTYEFFVEPIQGLITPERSLFFNNFGQNRDVGVMAYGQLFNGPNFDEVSRIQYAVGIFNGTRNGFLANQDGKFLSAFLNFHPFGEWRDSLLENFNIGGSVFAGNNATARRALHPADYRADDRQRGPGHPVPDPQQRPLPPTGADGLLGPACRVVLPVVRVDQRMAERLPGLREHGHPGEPDPAHPRPRRELLRAGLLPPDRRDPEQRGHRQAQTSVHAESGARAGSEPGKSSRVTITWTSVRTSIASGSRTRTGTPTGSG